MSADFYIKRGDRLPVLIRTLKFSDGVAIDLTGCTVRWKMVEQKSREVVVDAVATITSATEGKVEYAWQTPDTDAEGHFDGEWRVQYPDGKYLSVPTMNFVQIHVVASLA